MFNDGIKRDAAIEVLRQGLEAISPLEKEVYAETRVEGFEGSIGKHFRRVIDHYDAFRRGYSSEFINYSVGTGDERLEKDNRYAVNVGQEIIDDLNELDLNKVKLRVKDNFGISASIPGRELQVIAEHALQRYSIIAGMLKQNGYDVPENFGVVPSNYRNHSSS